MKRIGLLTLPLGLMAMAGCDSKPAESVSPENQTVKLFKEGKGVWFSDETRRLFALETAQVTEQPIPRRIRKTAQVFRAGCEGKPASAMTLVSVSEAEKLKLGQPVSLKPSAGSGPEINGQLVRLDTQTQTVLGQIEALLEFPDPQQRCAAGTFLSATFTNDTGKPVLVVPESALLNAADGCYVYTVNGTHLTRTRIKTGASSQGFLEILEGLYPGDSVAAKGVENLWLIELSAIKGGTPCCPVPRKKVEK